MNWALALTVTLFSTPAPEVSSETGLPRAPRATIDEADREVVAGSGILGLLRELDGDSTRLVFSADALGTTFEAMGNLVAANRYEPETRGAVRIALRDTERSVEIGAVSRGSVRTVEGLATREHRPLPPIVGVANSTGTPSATMAWNHP